MAGQKLSANQQRKVDTIRSYESVVAHVKRLTLELDSNRAARSQIIDNICSSISRELAQLRQKAMMAPVGTIADVAGSLAVLAGRAGTGIALKIRALNDGINTMSMQLDGALKAAMQPEKDNKPQAT